MTHVFRLQPDDAPRYAYIRQRMLFDEWKFALTRQHVEVADPVSAAAFLRDERSATFAMCDGGTSDGLLIAVASVIRHHHEKYAHRARLFAVFVEADHRRNGNARHVVSTAIEHARMWRGVEFIDLCVNDSAVAAIRLYDALGFVEWGRQRDAADSNGQRVTEVHMTLALRG